MNGSAKLAIADFVSHGGNLIVHGYGTSDAALINSIFEFDIKQASVFSSSSKDWPTVPFLTIRLRCLGTAGWLKGSLPDDAIIIYESGTEADTAANCAVIPYAEGEIISRWDRFNSAPVGSQNGGWLNVLDSAVRYDFNQSNLLN